MKKRTFLFLAAVILVPFILFWSVVGFSVSVPDFEGSGSFWDLPLPADYEPGDEIDFPVKYAVFDLEAQIWPVYISEVPTLVRGSILSFSYELADYISFDEGKVYEYERLTLHHPAPGETVGFYWCNITVTGPGGYHAWWQGDPIPLLAEKSPDNPAYYELVSGRCFFAVEGKYYAVGSLWAELDIGWEGQVVSSTCTVTVDF